MKEDLIALKFHENAKVFNETHSLLNIMVRLDNSSVLCTSQMARANI